MTLAPGTVVRGALTGAYVIGDVLGKGGQGTVYAATHKRRDEKVAVKVYSPTLDASTHANTLRAIIEHGTCRARGIAAPIDLAFDGVRLASISPLVNGISVRDWLASLPSGTLTERLAACAKIASTMQAMHHNGVLLVDVHEDQFLFDGSDARMVDLDSVVLAGGLSKGPVMVRPDVAAPEIASGQGRPTVSSDVFALAVVAHIVLTNGRHPFQDLTTGELLVAHPWLQDPDSRNTDEVVSALGGLDIRLHGKDVSNFLRRSYATDPNQRPTAAEVVDVLLEAIRRTMACPGCGAELVTGVERLGLTRCWSCEAAYAPIKLSRRAGADETLAVGTIERAIRYRANGSPLFNATWLPGAVAIRPCAGTELVLETACDDPTTVQTLSLAVPGDFIRARHHGQVVEILVG